MYHQGLNPNIYSGLAASKLYPMADAIQVACQMEEETKKKALMRALVASHIRSERTIADANWEKFVDKSQAYRKDNTNYKNSQSTGAYQILVSDQQPSQGPFEPLQLEEDAQD
ncbi:hypothetical protein CFP56_006409 [Quercus suber]|uniref:Uncharacterized protein n=1 Tax=Quercus suber TaxID=58331 RepID=A0AAW0LB65_QUESU